MGKAYLALILFALSLSGCVKLERPYPDIETYMLSVHREAPRFSARAGTLKVLNLQISPRFDGEQFVYRTGKLKFESDYYSRFFAPPADVITEELAKWIEESGLFQEVVYGPGRSEPEWFLEGKINALYGDFAARPSQAVLEITLTLTHDVQARSETVLHRTYQREIPLQEDTAAALASGWNQALEEILNQFVEEVAEELGK